MATQTLYRSGISMLSRRILTAGGRFVLVFHGVSHHRLDDVPRAAQPHLTADEFRTILGWVRERFALLTPREFLASTKPGVLLTFDDGFANNVVNVLPVLVECGAPSVFFVATQHIGTPSRWLADATERAELGWGNPALVPAPVAADLYDGMSLDQLRVAASHPLVTIAAHTVTHPSLPSCAPGQLLRELQESRRFLEEVTDSAVDLFAYPFGDYDRRAMEAVESSGYRAAFAVDSRRLGAARFEIPRVGIYAADPAYVSLKMSGLHRPARRGAPLCA